MSKTQEETAVWKKALIALSPLGYRLFRNQRYHGQVVRNGQVTPQWVDTGLTDGAGDLIGYKIITVTSEMVGKKIARFASIEAKTDTGTASADQKNFINQVKSDGGIAGIIKPKTGIEIT